MTHYMIYDKILGEYLYSYFGADTDLWLPLEKYLYVQDFELFPTVKSADETIDRICREYIVPKDALEVRVVKVPQ